MRFIATFLLLCFATGAQGSSAPYEEATRVTTALESMLSRMVEPTQHLVQVTPEVKNETREEVVEGETVTDGVERRRIVEQPKSMPGFVPESEELTAPEPFQTRKVFKTVTEPKLASLKVYVTLDQNLPEITVTAAKRMVQDYLFSTYPGIAKLKFSRIPMRPSLIPKPEELDQSDGEPSLFETLMGWLPWGLVALLVLMMVGGRRKGDGKPSWLPFPMLNSVPSQMSQSQASNQEIPAPVERRAKVAPAEIKLSGENRSRFMNKIIHQVQSFYQYFEQLSGEEQSEIETLLKGPAFERVMGNYPGPRMTPQQNLSEPNEKSNWHESQFDEFVSASKWQDGEFFGFLGQLSNEKILALISFESDHNVSIMIHFMKPEQSAYVLDRLDPTRRSIILSRLNDIHQIPLTEISQVEKQIRQVVHRLPSGMLGPGRQQVDLLSQILDVTDNADELLEVIEKTNPGVYPELKRFSFSLDDAASLPDEFLRRAVSSMENEELAMALAASAPGSREVILDALSGQRREILEAQIPLYATASKESLSRAKRRVNQKIREIMQT